MGALDEGVCAAARQPRRMRAILILARAKADTTFLSIRLKPDPTERRVRLKADTTYVLIPLKPDPA
jgi:hypothetical protein